MDKIAISTKMLSTLGGSAVGGGIGYLASDDKNKALGAMSGALAGGVGGFATGHLLPKLKTPSVVKPVEKATKEIVPDVKPQIKPEVTRETPMPELPKEKLNPDIIEPGLNQGKIVPTVVTPKVNEKTFVPETHDIPIQQTPKVKVPEGINYDFTEEELRDALKSNTNTKSNVIQDVIHGGSGENNTFKQVSREEALNPNRINQSDLLANNTQTPISKTPAQELDKPVLSASTEQAPELGNFTKVDDRVALKAPDKSKRLKPSRTKDETKDLKGKAKDEIDMYRREPDRNNDYIKGDVEGVHGLDRENGYASVSRISKNRNNPDGVYDQHMEFGADPSTHGMDYMNARHESMRQAEQEALANGVKHPMKDSRNEVFSPLPRPGEYTQPKTNIIKKRPSSDSADTMNDLDNIPSQVNSGNTEMDANEIRSSIKNKDGKSTSETVDNAKKKINTNKMKSDKNKSKKYRDKERTQHQGRKHGEDMTTKEAGIGPKTIGALTGTAVGGGAGYYLSDKDDKLTGTAIGAAAGGATGLAAGHIYSELRDSLKSLEGREKKTKNPKKDNNVKEEVKNSKNKSEHNPSTGNNVHEPKKDNSTHQPKDNSKPKNESIKTKDYADNKVNEPKDSTVKTKDTKVDNPKYKFNPKDTNFHTPKEEGKFYKGKKFKENRGLYYDGTDQVIGDKHASMADWLVKLPLATGAIGAGVGAATAKPGERSSGAMKGAIGGAAIGLGGGAVVGKNLPGIGKMVTNNMNKNFLKGNKELINNAKSTVHSEFGSAGIDVTNMKGVGKFTVAPQVPNRANWSSSDEWMGFGDLWKKYKGHKEYLGEQGKLFGANIDNAKKVYGDSLISQNKPEMQTAVNNAHQGNIDLAAKQFGEESMQHFAPLREGQIPKQRRWFEPSEKSINKKIDFHQNQINMIDQALEKNKGDINMVAMLNKKKDALTDNISNLQSKYVPQNAYDDKGFNSIQTAMENHYKNTAGNSIPQLGSYDDLSKLTMGDIDNKKILQDFMTSNKGSVDSVLRNNMKVDPNTHDTLYNSIVNRIYK